MSRPFTLDTHSQLPLQNKLRSGIHGVAAGAVLIALCSAVQAAWAVNEELEPCMNGGVSASGNYRSEAAEARARSMMAQGDAKLALEPCINGAVSASGSFPTQAQEDRFYAEVSLEPCMNGEVSATGEFPTQAVDPRIFAHGP